MTLSLKMGYPVSYTIIHNIPSCMTSYKHMTILFGLELPQISTITHVNIIYLHRI